MASLLQASDGTINERTAMVPFFVHFQIPAAKKDRRLAFVVQPEDFPRVLTIVKKCVDDMKHELGHYLLGEDMAKRISEDMESFEKSVIHSFNQWRGVVDEWKGAAVKRMLTLQERLKEFEATDDALKEQLSELTAKLTHQEQRTRKQTDKLNVVQVKLRATQERLKEAEKKQRNGEQQVLNTKSQLIAMAQGFGDAQGIPVKAAGPQIHTSPALPSMLESDASDDDDSAEPPMMMHWSSEHSERNDSLEEAAPDHAKSSKHKAKPSSARGWGSFFKAKKALNFKSLHPKPCKAVAPDIDN